MLSKKELQQIESTKTAIFEAEELLTEAKTIIQNSTEKCTLLEQLLTKKEGGESHD